ncbi:MAG: hypothetical protein JAY94_14735 [Candidatus Thiodiazotropha endolucinida]|nr:hypothetical protein [Candidatus Thiodiazotropha taylori]MCW4318767.1 hypothetical protein [Candidatus Thiodiazotropha taylori]
MDKTLIDEATRCLRVLDVYQRDAVVNLSDDYDPVSESQDVAIQYRIRPIDCEILTISDNNNPESKSEIGRFKTVCGVRLVNSDQEDDPEVLCEITTNFISDYAVVEKISDISVLKEFGLYNAPYHIWPYFREFIHSTCSRSRLPLVTIPMFRISDTNENSEELQEDKQKSSE